MEDWAKGKSGRLTTNIGGADWGVYVGQGEAYGAAMKDQEARSEAAV